MSKRLVRPSSGKSIGGVCAAFANYLDIDVTIVRLLFLLAFLFGSAGFWIYIVAWIVIPSEDSL